MVALAGCGAEDPKQTDDSSSGGSAASDGMTDDQALASFLDSLSGNSDPAAAAAAEYVDRIELADGTVTIVTTYSTGEEDYDVVYLLCPAGEMWAADNAREGAYVQVTDVDNSGSFFVCGGD